ncbi:Tubulin polyglutamylase ttll5 [Sparganum proliferum]
MRQARDMQRESLALSDSNPGKSLANIFRHRSSSKRGHEPPPLLNDNKIFLIDDTDKSDLPEILNSLSAGRDGPPTTNPDERSSLLMSATNKLDTDMSTRCDGCRELATRVLKLEVDVDLLTEIIASLLKFNKIKPPEHDTKDMKNINEPDLMNLKKPVKGYRRRAQRNKRQRTKSLHKSSDSTEMDGNKGKNKNIGEWMMDCRVVDRFSDLSEDPSKSPVMKAESREDLSLKALFSSSSFFNRTNTLEEIEAPSLQENIENGGRRLPTGHDSPALHNQTSQATKRPRSESNRSRRSSSRKKAGRAENEMRTSPSAYISRKIRSDSIWLNPILPIPFREAGIVWNGVYKRRPSLVFSPSVMVNRDTFVKILVEKLNMSCKFDLRLYVAVTSYDPLIIYVYEEGLARFATVRYQFGIRSLKNVCMHLTNYSVNKLNHDFVHNDDADVEDFGNKWSLGALLRYLRSEGKDTAGLMLRIEDIIIKSFLAVESPIVSACHLFQAGKNNCFELYGFDIIVDENLRPWLLEVNLSPSLACDTPLDFKVKSSMLADLLTLAGIQCHDPSRKYHAGVNHSSVNSLVPNFTAPRQPTYFVPPRNYLISEVPGSGKSCIFGHIYHLLSLQKRAHTTPTGGSMKASAVTTQAPPSRDSTTASWVAKNSSGPKEISIDECRFVRRLQEESARCGGWLRLFPNAEAWEQYSALFEAGPTFGTSSSVPSWLETSRTASGHSHSERRSTLRNPHNAEPIVHPACPVPQHTVYSKHLRTAIAIAAMNRINRSAFLHPTSIISGEEKQGGPAKCPIQTVHPNLTPPHVNLGLYTGLVDAKRSIEPVPEPRVTINLPPASQVFSTFHPPLHSLPPNILAESLMIVLGYENPNFTVTRVQARRIAACYVQTLGRLPFYHRKLGSPPVIVRGVCLSVNCDHTKRNGGRYCGIRATEEAEYPPPAVKWSTGLPISAQIMSLTPSSSSSPSSSPKSSSFQREDAVSIKPSAAEQENYLLKSESVRKMTKLQARSTFSTYLSRVYERLLQERDLDEDRAKEAEGQLELMLRFLQKAALNLSPFAVASICCGENVELSKEVDSSGDFTIPPFEPSSTIEEKRKHLVQVLDTFIRIYMYETALACSKFASDVGTGVEHDRFQKFLREATESELEAALSEYTKFNKSVSLFIGISQCNSVCRARTRPAANPTNFNRKVLTPRCGTGGSGGGMRRNLSNQSNHNWPKTSAKAKRSGGKTRNPLVCRDEYQISDRLVAMPMSQNRKMPKNACFAVCPCPVVNSNNKNVARRTSENMAFMLVRRGTTPQSRLGVGLDIRTDLMQRPSERNDNIRRTERQRSEPIVLTARSRESARTDKRRARLSSRSVPLKIMSGQKLAKLPTLTTEPLSSVESAAKDARASSRQRLQQREQPSPSSRVLSCHLVTNSSTTEPLSEVQSSRSCRVCEGSQVQSYRSLGLASLDSQDEAFGRDLPTSASADSVIPGRSLLPEVFPYLPNIPSCNLVDLS